MAEDSGLPPPLPPPAAPAARAPARRAPPPIPKALIAGMVVLGLAALGALRAVLRRPEAFAGRFAKLEKCERQAAAALPAYAKTFSSVDPKFKGVRAFAAELAALSPAKPWTPEELTVKNPDFWRALMEMLPQDPSACFAAADLYAAKGELSRADDWLVVGSIGMAPNWKAAHDGISAAIKDADGEIGAVVKQGTALHDEKKYDEAVAVYDSVLAAAPKSAWALYEKSFSMLSADQEGSKDAREKMYEQIRGLDPFYWQAYQGSDPDVIHRKLPALMSEIAPFTSGKDRGETGLAAFAAGCEKADVNDFAALAFWKHMPLGKDRDQDFAHFFFNLKRLGLGDFVDKTASPELLKAVAEIEAKAPAPLSGRQGQILQYGLWRMPDGKVPDLLRAADSVPANRGAAFGYVAKLSGVRDPKNWRIVFRHPPMSCPDAKGTVSSSPLAPPKMEDGSFEVMVLFRFDRPCELLKGRWTLQIVEDAGSLKLESGKPPAVSRREEVVLSKDFDVVAPEFEAPPAEAGAAEPPAAQPAPEAKPQVRSEEVSPEQKKRDAAMLAYCASEISMLCHDAPDQPRALRACLLRQKDDLLGPCRDALSEK